MGKGYSDEQSIQILIALLKEHGIKKVIVSPGAMNITFVGSIQYDPYFEIYSCVDERAAAYMACGMAAESGEAVCISCTGATASRNYLPGLTEAFYRKLPILAITSTRAISKVGQNVAQVIDRSNPPKDAVRHSVTLPIVKDQADFWDCTDKVNIALLELFRNGGGPVHINLQTNYSNNFSVKELPDVRVTKRITAYDKFPDLVNEKIAIFVGSHKKMSDDLINAIDKFCEKNNSLVFCDHTSGYNGKYKVLYALAGAQINAEIEKVDTLIYIGEITGDYYSFNIGINKQIWRVSDDGELKSPRGRVTYVFDMPEIEFFKYYLEHNLGIENMTFYENCKNQLLDLRRRIPELPYSNIWIASKLHEKLPENSVIHFGILNSLRAWNFFELDKSIESYSNVGGFGIDGCISTIIGASLVNQEKLYYLVVGDLAFFYDINSLGNRHIKNNIRILLVNNGKGTEFRNYNHKAAVFEDDADEYIAAAGHFGNKSRDLVKHYAEDLGFLYVSAATKEEFLDNMNLFTSKNTTNKPIIFEVFTDNVDESDALKFIQELK